MSVNQHQIAVIASSGRVTLTDRFVTSSARRVAASGRFGRARPSSSSTTSPSGSLMEIRDVRFGIARHATAPGPCRAGRSRRTAPHRPGRSAPRTRRARWPAGCWRPAAPQSPLSTPVPKDRECRSRFPQHGPAALLRRQIRRLSLDRSEHRCAVSFHESEIPSHEGTPREHVPLEAAIPRRRQERPVDL